MSIELDLQIASKAKTIPHPSQFQEWINTALQQRLHSAELTIRIVDEAEITQLNLQYRKKNGPTNVLTFPADIDPSFNIPLLGDIIICAPIIEQQAKACRKDLLAHWAHMVIHGALHLLNYQHQTNAEAEKMESLETEILANLGYPPPYGDQITNE